MARYRIRRGRGAAEEKASRSEDQIPAYMSDSASTQLAQEQPELFQCQTRVATAPQVGVSFQGAIGRNGVGQCFSLPGMRRAQDFQRRV